MNSLTMCEVCGGTHAQEANWRDCFLWEAKRRQEDVDSLLTELNSIQGQLDKMADIQSRMLDRIETLERLFAPPGK